MKPFFIALDAGARFLDGKKEDPIGVNTMVSARCSSFLRPAFNRIESSPIGYSQARGVFWSIGGAIISSGLILLGPSQNSFVDASFGYYFHQPTAGILADSERRADDDVVTT